MLRKYWLPIICYCLFALACPTPSAAQWLKRSIEHWFVRPDTDTCRPDTLSHITNAKPQTFDNEVNFRNDSFTAAPGKNISICHSVFRKKFSVENFNSDSLLYFVQDTFDDVVFIDADSFRQGINFSGSVFRDNVYFRNVSAGWKLNLRNATFLKNAYFSSISFESQNNRHSRNDKRISRLNLSGIKLGENAKLYFEIGDFPDIVDCSKITDISGTIELTHTRRQSHLKVEELNIYILDPGSHIILSGSDISRIHCSLHDFQIMFPPSAEYEDICLAYEAILKGFKDRGQSLDYQFADIAYQRLKDPSSGKWQSEFSGWWWNFGYDKEWIFDHLLFFIFVFTMFTFLFINYLCKCVYSINNFPQNIPAFHKNGWIYRILSRMLFLHRGSNFKAILLIAAIVIILQYVLYFDLSFPHIALMFVRLVAAGEFLLFFLLEPFFFTFLTLFIIYKAWVSLPFYKRRENKAGGFDQLIRGWGVRLWYSFIYTANLLFPIFLKYANLKYKSVLGTLYVFMVYAIGLFCVGYIANFIIQK